MLDFTVEEKTVMEERFIPHVIEPSFGIDRVVYVIMEHAFRVRPGAEIRTYFQFPSLIAPLKCSVLPLTNHEQLLLISQQIS